MKERDLLGSPETRRLRKQGLIPGVLYGKGEPQPFLVGERALRSALTTTSGLHAVLDVVLEGQSTTHPSILKDYQRDPIRGHVAHIDLQEVRLDKPIHAVVSVHIHGTEDAPGVREGGVMSQPTIEINVEALPMEVPESIEVDVSGLEMGGSVRLEDVTVPKGVTLLDDLHETVLATVSVPMREEELEAAIDEAAAEGLAVDDAEQAPEDAAEEPGEGDSEGDAEASLDGEPDTEG